MPTGVEGLDELIEGGIPKRRMVLVSGATGTGKTVLSTQFLYKGAVEYDEPGIFVTLDERPDILREDMLQFGWDLAEEEAKDMIRIIDASIAKIGFPSEEIYHMPESGFDLDKLLIEIVKSAKEMGAKRIVVDSLPALGFRYTSEAEIRNAVLKVSYVLRKTGLTAIITSEIEEGSKRFSKFGVEEFVADGVIVLAFPGSMGPAPRTLHIRKMRGTDHSPHIHPVEIIRNRGMVVYPVD